MQNSKGVPGPASYYVDKSASISVKKDPVTVFGTDKRRGIYTRNANPGPGSYSLNRSLSMKAVVISGKRTS